MAYKIYKFRDLSELELHLNGGLIAGDIRGGIPGLEGLTLDFTLPSAVTVTFGAPTNGVAHTLQEIKDTLEGEGGPSGIHVFQKDGKLTLQADAGVSITGGTALAKFGIGAAGASAAPYNAPGGAAPAIVQVYADAQFQILVAKES